MDTLKNYLETMFMQLPNTTEVLKAKAELGQMMEDKFNEMVKEGKPENEAIATVLAEFGNLDEIAETLGIKYLVKQKPVDRRLVKLDEAKEYVKDRDNAGFRMGLGVALCIMSPIGAALLHGGFSALAFFTAIAAGIALFVVNSISSEKWEFLRKTKCAVEFATVEQMERDRDAYRPLKAIYMCVGIMLCVLCPFIAAAADDIPVLRMVNKISVIGFFVPLAAGVFFIILANVKDNAFLKILTLNDSKTVGGNYVDTQKTARRLTKTGQTIMSVFWPTVTCLYFVISFVTMQWWITWLIWVIAAIVQEAIKSIFAESKYND